MFQTILGLLVTNNIHLYDGKAPSSVTDRVHYAGVSSFSFAPQYKNTPTQLAAFTTGEKKNAAQGVAVWRWPDLERPVVNRAVFGVDDCKFLW